MLARIVALALGVIALTAGTAMAQTACPSYPVTLQNGTIADATEVMQDFDAVRNCVNNNQGLQSGTLTTAGTQSAQTLAATAITAYAAGQRILLKVGAGLTNTAGVTLNVNGLGARNVMRPNGQPMRGGEFREGRWNEVIYDGTQFLLINTQGLSMVDGTSLSDNVTSTLFWGFGGCCGGAAQIVRQTTPNVTTSPTHIASTGYGALAIVVGNSGGNVFQDVILFGYGIVNPTVMASMTGTGGPVPSRSYTSGGLGDIRLALSGGHPPYDVTVTALVGNTR